MDLLNRRYEPAVPIDKLRPHELNPREGDLGAISQSIAHNGFYGALIVQESTGKILAGNHRYRSAIGEGAETLPVIYIDCDNETAKRILIADNRSNDLSSYNHQALAELLASVQSDQGDLTGTLYDAEDYDRLISDLEKGYVASGPSSAKHNPDDEEDSDVVRPQVFEAPNAVVKTGNCDDDEAPEPEPEIPPVSQLGDLWICGDHRVLCGSATAREDVDRVMDGQRAHLIVTDPPYNVAYVGKTKKALTIQNDSMSASDFYQFLFDVYTNLYAVTHDGGGIYVFHADTEGMNFRKALVDAGFKLSQCCVWVKNSLVMGRQDYHWKHEPVLYGWKPTAAHKWYSDRSQTTVWNHNRPSRSEDHPTMKPIALIEYPIGNSSQPGELVLDVFGGSGSTLIAAEKHSRLSRIIELEPKYVDVIVKRWQTFSGRMATLENDGRTFADVDLARTGNSPTSKAA